MKLRIKTANLITNMRNTTTAFIPRGRACDHDDCPASLSTWMVHVVDNGGNEEDELVHGVQDSLHPRLLQKVG